MSLFKTRTDRESGRIVTMVPLAALAALLCVGIAVDLGGQTMAEQDLRDIAAHCAREGAAEAVLGGANSQVALEVANQCLGTSGLTGTTTLAGDSLIVTLTSTYNTKLLTLIGIGTLPVDGTASVVISQGR